MCHSPSENNRPSQVMHFGIEEAEQNYDYFGNKSTIELTKPLMAIVVLYLSNVTRGGEILFPESEVREKRY
jgi:prolyl 4-hydroxylase